MRNIFILVLSFFALTVSAQPLIIKGAAYFEESKQIAYQVEILLTNNTSVVKKTFETSVFELDSLMNAPYKVKLTAMAYKPIEIILGKSKTPVVDLGAIYFKPDYYLLDSVTVTARRPEVRMKGSKMTVNIKNTILSDMGSVKDMLLNTPGLIQSSSGIEVPGKGTPLFIVDGKEIKDLGMLDILKSDNVENIEIDRSPSAAYSASTKAVVTINTIRGIQDYLFLRANYLFSAKRKISNTPSLDFRFKKGIVSSSMSYLYSNGGSLVKETYYRDIYHPDYTFTSSSYHEIPAQYQGHKFNWSTDFYINKKNSLGLVYYFNQYERDARDLGNTTITDSINETLKYEDRNTLSMNHTHSISLSYRLIPNKNSQFLFVGDYATSRINNNTRAKETELNTGAYTDIQTTGKSLYNILTAKGQYDFKLPYSIKAQTGSQFSYVTSPVATSSDNPYLYGGNYYNNTNIDDYKIAGFFSASRDWKKFGLRLGLRYEYVSTYVSTQDNANKNDVSRKYSDFFPNAALNYTLNNNWNFSLNYSRSTTRPGYYFFNSSSVYQDSLSYTEGNSAIRTSFTNDISLYVNWKNWSLDFGYSNITDPLVQVLICKNTYSNITSFIPINFSRVQNFNSGLSYQKTGKKFSWYASLRGTLPHVKYPFMNETITTKMLQLETAINSTYYLNKKFSIYTNFSYTSPNEYMNINQKSVNRWNLGIRGKFLKDRLNVDLQFMDILHGSNYNNLYTRYLNIKDGTRGTNDFRGVRINLSYVIFKNDIQVKAKRENEDVLMRTSN